jgi:site-specific recombinase XerD
MATIKAILNTKYQSKDNTYPIVIRIIDGDKQKLHPIGYKVKEKHFEKGQVTQKHPDCDIINSVIDDEVLKAKKYFADCRIKNIPVDMDLVFKEIKSHSFTGYLKHRAKQHRDAGQVEMEYKVDRYVKELDWCFEREIFLNEVTADLLRVFDTWLMKDNEDIGKVANSANTRAKKFEFLGKYFTNAIDEGKAQPPNPFKKYKIKTTPVKKEKLSAEQIKAIEDLPLKKGYLKLCRDLFLFSYYCKGLRFENCISMPKTALNKGRLIYTINKSNRPMSTLIHPKLQSIINSYIKNDTDTIFARFNTNDLLKNKRNLIGSENAYINKGLKDIAMMAGVKPFSFHIARHSFAFNLKKVTDNIHVIKDSLGHAKTSTTEAYLQSLDDEFLDDEVAKLYGN